MAAENDPTKKFLEAAQKYQSRLLYLWKNIFKKVKSYLKSMASFVNNFIAAAKQLASTIGKSVVDKFVKAAQWVVQEVQALPNAIKAAMRFGKKVIALIQKAADPNKIISTLKKLFSRYVRMVKEIFGRISEMAKQLDVLGPMLSIINSFKNALRMIFSWIKEVTRINDAVVKTKRLLKKVIKEMKKEVKEAEKMRKEVMKLKIAA